MVITRFVHYAAKGEALRVYDHEIATNCLYDVKHDGWRITRLMDFSDGAEQLFDVGGRGDVPPREVVEEIVRNHWQAIANWPYGERGGL